jgi:hypothetical protein
MMRRLVWIAPWLAAVCVSCTGGGNEVTTPKIVKKADIVRQDEGVTSRYYAPGNPYTNQLVNDTREDAVVQPVVRRFESLGYTCEPHHSFVAEGEGPDGESVEMVTLAMSRVDGANTQAVYVLDVRAGESEWVVPLTVSFAAPPIERDVQQISEGVWLALAGEPVNAGRYLSAAQLPWREWLQCVAERIVAGAATCAWSCRFAAGLYLACITKCTEGYAIYALVACTIQML